MKPLHSRTQNRPTCSRRDSIPKILRDTVLVQILLEISRNTLEEEILPDMV